MSAKQKYQKINFCYPSLLREMIIALVVFDVWLDGEVCTFWI